MKKYILKRVLTSLGTLLAIILVLFILMQLMPGSPFNDEKLTEDQRVVLYAKYGLDQPIIVQFGRYVVNMCKGDFGVSYNISKNTPISQLIQTRLPISIAIGGMAVLIGTIIGLILGILAAVFHDTVVDSICTIISVIGVSVPSYVFALALSYSFGFKLGWFPMLFSQNDITYYEGFLDLFNKEDTDSAKIKYEIVDSRNNSHVITVTNKIIPGAVSTYTANKKSKVKFSTEEKNIIANKSSGPNFIAILARGSEIEKRKTSPKTVPRNEKKIPKPSALPGLPFLAIV